jgi:hypothetical protein
MSTTGGPSIVKDGLVLALDAANQKSYPGSGTTWNDLSGNGNNGTLVNGVEYSNDNLGVISFDGTNEFTTINPNSSNLTLNNETYIFWVKCNIIRNTTTGGSFNNWIIHYGNYFSNNSGGFGLQSGRVAHFLKGSTSSGWSRTGTSAAGDAIYDNYDWVYYVLQIVNNNNIKFFMNNTLIFNSSISDGYTGYQSDKIVIGRRMDMTLSNVYLYNKVLSPEEILQNYNATKGRYGL